MLNSGEMARRLRDAEDCLRLARQAFQEGSYRGSLQNSQVCVELSAKTVISVFEEPQWTHDPSGQLKKILETHADKINQPILKKLLQLADDAHVIAPWHGWTVYGMGRGPGWKSALEACTQERAEWGLQLAERSFQTAKDFQKWFQSREIF